METHGKFLGVEIDNKLRFNYHINNVCDKLSKTTGILYKLKEYVPTSVMIKLYNALAYPYLFYCNIVWGGTFSCHLNSLHKLQKRIIRVVNNADYLAHTGPLFKRNNILNIYDLHKYVLGIYMHKVNNNVIEDENINLPSHNFLTRSRNDYIPEFQRLALTQHSYTFTAPNTWNTLPREIRDIKSILVFKKLSKQHYLNLYEND